MRQYASDKVVVSWTGLDLTPGLAEGSFVVIRRNVPTWTQRDNGVGGTIRLFNPSRSGEVDLLLDTESKTHQQLLILASVDRLTKAIQAPLIVFDGNTRETFVFTNAYLMTEPDEQRATTSVEVTWTFAFTTIEHVPNPSDQNVVGG
jgi:hypothetical protein